MIAGTYAGLRWGRLRPAIPRASGFNGGIVFDCPRFARINMSYGICGGVTFSLMACALVELLRQGSARAERGHRQGFLMKKYVK